uniref:BY PROTMAP: gi/472581686/gb/EMS19409.1/ U4/U6 small nuclear ribonucleoprotein PRP3 [Rhodosporidium toruloides NP11] gi/647398351/emb/CDR42185.1/ RHTO0S06e10726g1_1 [Rhodosporidium toruloides] n=1 Tax=Rhodotorula toruloides TaxID=5286 RepID=A0A0K3CCK5_RHOTO
MSDRKRANVFGDDDPISPHDAKKPRGCPAAPSFVPTPIPSTLPPRPAAAPPAGGPPIDIAAKRAEILAKLAKMKGANGGGLGAPPASASSSSAPPPAPPSAGLPQRSTPNLPSAPPQQPGLDPDIARKIAEAKKRVAEMAAKSQAQAQAKANPYLSATFQGKKKEPAIDASVAAKGGLAVTAHPLLLDNSVPAPTTKKDRYKPMAPKFSTTKANVSTPSPRPATPVPSTSDVPAESLTATPFFDPRLGYGSAGVTGKSHMGKGHARQGLHFRQAGTYIKKGEAMRAEARMDELKQRILESSQKAGVQSDLEETAKKVRRPPPPDIEWWDEGYVPEKTYESYSTRFLDESPLISHLVQHPISIPAPQDKNKVELKPLFLTKKEMKKMRRIRRQAELKDKQDRQKMGLLPPDPPKVKISNMMRVLTQEAISDPTKVEAQVRREIVARERKHLKDNAERKLTAEERAEKREGQFAQDEAKGIQAVAFKVRYLTDPSHKFKVKKNAIDWHLTGRILHNPKFCLVVVEGGAKSIKKYRQLMLNRIRWTEEAAPRAGGEDDAPKLEDHGGILRPAGPFTAPDEPEEPQSLADNYCREVWSGAHRERVWADMARKNCPSESSAREVLGKLAQLWDIAKVEEKVDEFDI